MLPAAVVAQALFLLPAPVPPEVGVDPMRYVLPVTTGAMCVWAALNRGLPGMWLVLLGAGCNLAVICANGGLMPTNAEALARAGKHENIRLAEQHPGIRFFNSKDILLPPEETRLWWLSDVIVSPPLPQRKVMSVGDLFIAAGLAYLAGRATYAPIDQRRTRDRRTTSTRTRHSTQENAHDARDTGAPKHAHTPAGSHGAGRVPA